MNLTTLFEIGMDRMLPLFKHPGPRQLNLGGDSGKFKWPVESVSLPDWDAEKDALPFKDSSVDTIWALHFLEHIQNIHLVLSECQRVLVPGGTMNIVVPHGTSVMALQDLNHRRFFTLTTWKNTFRNPYYDDHSVRWQFDVGVNIVMGITEENTALVTQLIKHNQGTKETT